MWSNTSVRRPTALPTPARPSQAPFPHSQEPWTAPLEVQRKAKCIIGVDYPHPIVDHAIAHKEGIRRMALAYKAGK